MKRKKYTYAGTVEGFVKWGEDQLEKERREIKEILKIKLSKRKR